MKMIFCVTIPGIVSFSMIMVLGIALGLMGIVIPDLAILGAWLMIWAGLSRYLWAGYDG